MKTKINYENKEFTFHLTNRLHINSHRIFRLTLIICLALSTIPSMALQEVTLQLKWKHQFQFAGFYAAIAKGYYKNVGLDVKLIEAKANEEPTESVFKNKLNFGISTSDIILSRYNGHPAVVLAPIFQHSPQVLIASKLSGINHVHDLIGSKIMLEPHAADIINYLSDEGVSLKQLIIKPHSFGVSELLDYNVDVITAYKTDEPYILDSNKFEYTIISPLSGGIDFYGDILFTTEEMIRNSPELVAKFLQASLQGWKYAMDNKEEIVNLIYHKYSKRHSKAHLMYEANEMHNYINPNVVEIGYSNRGRWNNIVAAYRNSGLIKNNFNAEGMFYSDYLQPEMYIPWGWIGIIAFIAISVAVIAFYYFSLSSKLKSEILKKQKFQEKLEIANNEILAEMELKKTSEAKLRKLTVAVEQSPVSIVITDINAQIEYANPYFFRHTGYTIDEVKGKTPKLLSAGKTDRKIYDELWSTINSGKIWNGEFINLKKNGEEYIEHATIAPVFDEQGNTINYIAIKEDITVQKKFEIALKLSKQQLEELNTTKDKFFSIIAHDLKNPLGNFKNVTELLADSYNDFSELERIEFIQLLKESSGDIYSLLENLLVWSRSQSGIIQIKKEKFNLWLLLIEVIKLMKPIADKKNIELVHNIPAGAEINADRNMINTVIRNLISNAIKFTPDGGQIEIGMNEDYSVYVKDSGVGMSEQIIHKLFRIDTQVTARGTNQETGTGLGLILCKEFIDKHNGTIWVNSEITKGSTFSFKIPSS